MSMLVRFYEDLKRRGVFRVAAIYAVTGWAVSEVAISIEEPLQLPGWIDTSIIVVVALGFPVALVLAYAFNLTPEGLTPDHGESPADDAAASPAGARTSSVVLGAALVAAAAIIAWQNLTPAGESVSQRGEASAAEVITDVSRPVPGYGGRKAIAVLPFLNMSGDANQGYLADGIAEDIITELYSFQTFPVIARTSTFRYKGQDKDVREIAKELGAGYVLEGSVRRIGDRIRVTAQLIDANGQHLWAENYDTPWSDVMAVHDDITYSIVEAIEPELIRREVERRRHVGTEDMVAWDYYLRARALSAEEFASTTLSGVPITMETTREAWRLANKALETAPDFAALYSLMSHIDGASVLFIPDELGPEGVERAVKRGLENAAHARSLDPFEATACACQIVLLLFTGDIAGAVEVGEEALEQNPGSAFILAGMAKAVSMSGDHRRALELIQKAKRLSPKGISMTTYLSFEALIRQSLGDFEGARKVVRQSRRLSTSGPNWTAIEITTHYAEGNRNAALRAMRALEKATPDYKPTDTWPELFPQAVIDRVDEPMRSRLEGRSYAEGVALILEDLGWRQKV